MYGVCLILFNQLHIQYLFVQERKNFKIFCLTGHLTTGSYLFCSVHVSQPNPVICDRALTHTIAIWYVHPIKFGAGWWAEFYLTWRFYLQQKIYEYIPHYNTVNSKYYAIKLYNLCHCVFLFLAPKRTLGTFHEQKGTFYQLRFLPDPGWPI